MEINGITIEQYVEHEVKIRVMKEVTDVKFKHVHWIFGLILSVQASTLGLMAHGFKWI